MKFKGVILALLVASITPVYGSESVPKSEEDTKSRMALVAAGSASGEAVADQDAQRGIVSKPKSDDEQLRDGIAMLRYLSGKEADGDTKGLPKELRKIVMGYLQQIETGDLLKRENVYSFARKVDIEQNAIVVGSHHVCMYDKHGKFLEVLDRGPLDDTGYNGRRRPYSHVLVHDMSAIGVDSSWARPTVTAGFGTGHVCTWNMNNGEALPRQLLSRVTVDKPCVSLAFNKHDTLLGASISDRKKGAVLGIWDVYKNSCIKELPVGDCTTCLLTQDSNNKMIVVVGKHDGHIELLDIKTGKRISVLRGHTDICTSGSKILQLNGDQEWTKKREIQGLAACKNRKNGHLLIASSGRCDATGQQDGLVYLWDANTGECLQLLYLKVDGWVSECYSPMRVVGMDYNDKDDLEVYVSTGDSVKALRCVPGEYEQADNLEKATAIVQGLQDSSGTYNGQGLPPELRRIVYEYAKPA